MKAIPIIFIIFLSGCLKNPVGERMVVIVGDSYSLADKWPLFLKDSSVYFRNVEQVNYAISGQQAYQMHYDYSKHQSKTNGEYWFFCYAGVNDLAGAGRSSDTVYAALKSTWASARKAGFIVVAFTVIHSLFLTKLKEAERVKLNNMIFGNRSLYDYVIDVASYFDPRIQPELFVDKTHLTEEGNRMFAGIVARL